MVHGRVERLDRLPGKRAAAHIGQRTGNHHRNPGLALARKFPDGKDRRLRIQRIEKGFDQDQVGPPVDQSPHLIVISLLQFVERNRAGSRTVYIGRDRRRTVTRSDGSRNEPRLRGVRERKTVGRRTGQRSGCTANVVNVKIEHLVGQRKCVRIERIGRNNIGASLQVSLMDFGQDIGPRQRKRLVAPFERHRPVSEHIASVILLTQAIGLHHRAQTAVQHQDTAGQLGK